MLNNGSTCGKPSTGAANFLRKESPTSPFQSGSSIKIETLLIFPDDSESPLLFDASSLQENNKKERNRSKIDLFILG